MEGRKRRERGSEERGQAGFWLVFAALDSCAMQAD